MTPGPTDAPGNQHREMTHRQDHSRTRHPDVPERARSIVRPGQGLGRPPHPSQRGMWPDAMLWQEQALKTRTDTPNLTSILTRTGYQYQTTWVKGLPMSHNRKIHVHVNRDLGIEGPLPAYELVGPTWELNIIKVHVLFGDATDTFLEHLMEAYQQLAMKRPTIITGDFNAAPTMDDRGGGPTQEDTAVRVALQHLGL